MKAKATEDLLISFCFFVATLAKETDGSFTLPGFKPDVFPFIGNTFRVRSFFNVRSLEHTVKGHTHSATRDIEHYIEDNIPVAGAGN